MSALRRLWPLLIPVLAGCASYQVPQADFQPFNSQAHDNIKTIGILMPAVEQKLHVRVVNPAENNLPLLGPLIAKGLAATRSDRFTELARQQGFDNRKALALALAEGVKQAGYTVRGIKAEREPGEFLSDYPDDVQVDALLDTYGTHAGYYAAGTGTPYRPTVFVGARLVDARSGRILFSDSLVYNPIGETGDAITLLADPQYAYADFDEIMDSLDAALQGLKGGYQSVGKQIGVLLK